MHVCGFGKAAFIRGSEPPLPRPPPLNGRGHECGVGDCGDLVVGDSLVCVGPPDSIVKGSSTVMIGGKPAARMGDTTAHGGSIVLGCPTVMIGG